MSLLVTQDSLLSGTEKEDVKNIISIEIIKDNIIEQINNVEKSNNSITNYIDIFKNQYEYCMKSFSDDYESIEEIQVIKRDFYDLILKNIYEKFKFSLVFNEKLLQEEIDNITYILYKFFIINWKENVEIFYTNKIIEDYKEIIEVYKDKINTKDFMYLLIKKDFNIKDFAIPIFIVDKYFEEMEYGYFEDIFSLIIKNEEDEEDNIIINRCLINLEDTNDISIDMEELEEIIKETLKNNYYLVLSAKKSLNDYLKKMDESK